MPTTFSFAFRSPLLRALIFLLLLGCIPASAWAINQQHVSGADDIGLFCLLAGLVLFPSYLFSWVCGRINLPEFVGALFIGLLLGQTGLGSAFPELHASLFPNDAGLKSMISLVSFLGAATLMFDAGLAVNLKSVSKSAGQCTTIGVAGLVIITGVGTGVLYVSHWFLNVLPSEPFLGPLVITALMAISPLVIIFKLLDECRLVGSEVAAIKLGSSALGELVALLGVSILATICAQAEITTILLMIPALAASLGLIYAAPAVERTIRKVFSAEGEQTRAIRTVAILMVLYGAFFSYFSLPIVFGFFLAGVLINATSIMNAHVRRLFTQVAHQVWVPFFFAASVFEVNFVSAMNWTLLFMYLAIAVLTKGVGTYLLSRMAGLTKFDSRLTAASFTPIAVAGIALMPTFEKIGMISQEMYTAFLGATVLTTVIGGTCFKYFVGSSENIPLVETLDREIVDLSAPAKTWPQSKSALPTLLKELCEKTCLTLQLNTEEMLLSIEQDHNIYTGENSDHGFLALHLHAENVDTPRLILARVTEGITLPSSDGQLTRFIALLALPIGEQETAKEVALWRQLLLIMEQHQASELVGMGSEEIIDRLLGTRIPNSNNVVDSKPQNDWTSLPSRVAS